MAGYVAIMHIYNEDEHLRHVFDALNRQFLKPLSVFVVDDGSTDTTHDIIHEYGYNHAKITQPLNMKPYIRRANAFNYALKRANEYYPECKYVLKLDGDTLMLDSYAKYCFDYMEKNPRCVACSGISMSQTKTRDLNNGAVLYRNNVLPYAKIMYGWDRDIQLKLVSMGYDFKVLKTTAYQEMRVPTVGKSGMLKAIKNRLKTISARIEGYVYNKLNLF